jgi:hypothetical protein
VCLPLRNQGVQTLLRGGRDALIDVEQ